MIYVTGDTHGEVSRFEELKRKYFLSRQDTLIVAGDFGCIFGMGRRDEAKLDVLAALPYTILFLDGNHECFPEIFAYPEEMWNGGRIHRIRPNVLHLMRGQVYDLNGLTVFTMGGGCSIDAMYRTPGRTWWPEEMPGDAEYAEAWENLKRHGNEVDVIISHAAPERAMQLFTETGVIENRFPQEMRLNLFLEEVRRKVAHRHYYFGHMHVDQRLSDNMTALYYDVYQLETGRKATAWGDVGELAPEFDWGEPQGDEVW